MYTLIAILVPGRSCFNFESTDKIGSLTAENDKGDEVAIG